LIYGRKESGGLENDKNHTGKVAATAVDRCCFVDWLLSQFSYNDVMTKQQAIGPLQIKF
jgi:hypothetical protein